MTGCDAGCEEAKARGRAAAGEDPKKRAQILEGAGRVISRMGYDAASVSDIAREAGVSKGTIYVYFSGKEDLFIALMEETRERIFGELAEQAGRPGPLDEKLRRYASTLVRLLNSEPVIRAHRVVIAVTERMPEMGRDFYEKASTKGSRLLGSMLEAEVAAGRLKIDNIPLAALQFFELSMVGIFRRRLFGHMPNPPTEAEIAATVDEAVKTFLCRYGV